MILYFVSRTVSLLDEFDGDLLQRTVFDDVVYYLLKGSLFRENQLTGDFLLDVLDHLCFALDGWAGGWMRMDAWVGGWMVGWMDDWVDRCVGGWMDGRRDGLVGG